MTIGSGHGRGAMMTASILSHFFEHLAVVAVAGQAVKTFQRGVVCGEGDVGEGFEFELVFLVLLEGFEELSASLEDADHSDADFLAFWDDAGLEQRFGGACGEEASAGKHEGRGGIKDRFEDTSTRYGV